MRNWKWPYWSRRRAGRATSAVVTAEDGVLEGIMPAAATGGWEVVSLLGDVEPPPTPMHLEVDDGLTVPVLLSEQNAPLILESTQRLREYREREKSSVPPVYNFGGDSQWSGGGD